MEFSTTKITPNDNVKIPSMNGNNSGYMETDELKEYVNDGLITQSITDGDTTHSPSGDAVNGALNAINGVAVKRFSLENTISCRLNIPAGYSCFLVTNSHWEGGGQYAQNSVTLVKTTAESGTSIFKAVLLGHDIYTVTRNNNLETEINVVGTSYPGGKHIWIIDLLGTISSAEAI